MIVSKNYGHQICRWVFLKKWFKDQGDESFKENCRKIRNHVHKDTILSLKDHVKRNIMKARQEGKSDKPTFFLVLQVLCYDCTTSLFGLSLAFLFMIFPWHSLLLEKLWKSWKAERKKKKIATLWNRYII